MTVKFPFFYDESGYFINDKAFILCSSDTNLLILLTGILNSRVAKLWIWHHCPDLVGGAREVRKVFFENIPIPCLESDKKNKIIELTKVIIYKRKENVNFSSEIAAIESILADYYDFTIDERKALDNFVAMLNNLKEEDDEEKRSEQPALAKPIAKKEVKRILPEPEDDYLD